MEIDRELFSRVRKENREIHFNYFPNDVGQDSLDCEGLWGRVQVPNLRPCLSR